MSEVNVRGQCQRSIPYLLTDTHAARYINTENNQRFIDSRSTTCCCHRSWLYHVCHIWLGWHLFRNQVNRVGHATELTYPELKNIKTSGMLLLQLHFNHNPLQVYFNLVKMKNPWKL